MIAQPLRRTRKPSPPEDEVRRLHTRGFSDTRIATRMGYSQPVMSMFMRRLGLTPNRTRAMKFRTERIVADDKRQEQDEEAAALGWPGRTLIEARVMNRLSRYAHECEELAEELAVTTDYMSRVLLRLITDGLVCSIQPRRRPLYRALRINQGPEIRKILHHGRG